MKKFTMLFLCLLVFFSTTNAYAVTFEEFTKEANIFIKKKSATKADAFIKYCDKTLLQPEINAEFKSYILSTRGHAFWLKKDFEKGIKDAREALSLNEKNLLSYAVLVDGLLSKKEWEEAAKTVETAAQYAKDNEQKEAMLAEARELYIKAKTITPEELWNTFNENEVLAEDLYKEKVVIVAGLIESITTDMQGYPVVSFAVDRFKLHKVMMRFDKDERPSVAKLKKGQKVVLQGVCTGMILKNVIVDDSKIIE